MQRLLKALKDKWTRGFTLLETLVAATIIVIAVEGPFLAAERAYVASLDAKNRLIASHLAQEGLEYVRKLRDDTYLNDYRLGKADLKNTAYYNDFLEGEDGGTNIPNSSTSVYRCENNGYNEASNPTSPYIGGDGGIACALDLDPTKTVGVGSGHALQVCTQLTCSDKPLYLKTINGIPTYTLDSSGTPTIYRRAIRFYDYHGQSREVAYTSTVTWAWHGISGSVSLTGYLSPWQQ